MGTQHRQGRRSPDSRRARVVVVVLLGLLAASVLAAASAEAGGVGRSAPRFAYVALGDSFSAGEGVAPYLRDGVANASPTGAPNACHRSTRAYPMWVTPARFGSSLYAIASGGPRRAGPANTYGSERNVRSAGGVTWSSWACSGATTRTVLSRGRGGLATADLVTLTIGGNDVGFAGGLVVCALSNCNTQAFRTARTAAIDGIRPLLESVYAEVAKQAPRARILVLGYPQLFPATSSEQACPGLRLFRGEQPLLRKLATRLNATIATSVAAVARSDRRVQFVPVAGRFAGHEVCGRQGSWLHGLDLGGGTTGAGAFHPTAEGQRGYAAAVNAALLSPR